MEGHLRERKSENGKTRGNRSTIRVGTGNGIQSAPMRVRVMILLWVVEYDVKKGGRACSPETCTRINDDEMIGSAKEKCMVRYNLDEDKWLHLRGRQSAADYAASRISERKSTNHTTTEYHCYQALHQQGAHQQLEEPRLKI